MHKPFSAYDGDEPYFFVSYARDEAALVYPEMAWIRDAGFNLWYDDGIQVGSVWRQALAEALTDAAGLIFFATARSTASSNCLRELNFVLDEDKPVIVVQLDDEPLPAVVRLSLSDRQALVRSEFEDHAYQSRLVSALDSVLGTASRTVSATGSKTERTGPNPIEYRFGEYLLSTAHFSLTRAGERVNVEPQVLKCLIYLIENRDRVVSQTELCSNTIGRRVVDDNALDDWIRAARAAVADTEEEQSVIAAGEGGGYQFVHAVESSSRQSTGRVSEKPAAAKTAAEGNAGVEHAQPSIAVLPFDLIAGGEAEHTIARGLTQDIISRVGYCRSMFVIARGTSFQFTSGHHDTGEVGARLGVRYVCQGAVQIVGNQFRVSVGLADTHEKKEIWTTQYNGSLIDVLAIQEEIAESIVSSLDYEVQRNEMRLAALLPSSNLDSWSAFHRGLDRMYRFRASECDQAEALFRRAVDLEPGLARPYAGMSFVNFERAYLNMDDNRERSLRSALDQAKQAVDTDPLDPMGHWALSRAYFLAQDLESAQKAISIATELNPSYASAQYFHGWIAMQLGEHSLCRERVELARRLSPQDPLIYGMNGVAAMNFALTGDKAKALEHINQSLVHPRMHYQARAMCVAIFSVIGEPELAAEQLRQVRSVDPGYDLDDFFRVYSFQHSPDIDKIKRGFEEAERLV